MTPSQTNVPRPLMPYKQGILAVDPRGPVIPAPYTGIFAWDMSQPADDYYEWQFPALNRSDKAILAQILGSLEPPMPMTYAMRFPLGPDGAYVAANMSLASNLITWTHDDATLPGLLEQLSIPTQEFYWFGSPAGTTLRNQFMRLSQFELSVGADGVAGGPHLIATTGGAFAQNAGIRTGQWAPDVPTSAAFLLSMDAMLNQYRFLYAAAPLATPIAWTPLATLDSTYGLAMLNGLSIYVARDPIAPLEVATKQYVDAAVAGMGGGIPPGGNTGTMLTKTSPANFATDWETADGGTY